MLEIDLSMSEQDLDELMTKFLYVSQCNKEAEETPISEQILETVEDMEKFMLETRGFY